MSAQHFKPVTHISAPKIVVHDAAAVKSNFGRSISVDGDEKSVSARERSGRSRSPWKMNPFHRKTKRQDCRKLTKAESEELEEEDVRSAEAVLDEEHHVSWI